MNPIVRFAYILCPTVRFGAVNHTEPHRTDRKKRTVKNPDYTYERVIFDNSCNVPCYIPVPGMIYRIHVRTNKSPRLHVLLYLVARVGININITNQRAKRVCWETSGRERGIGTVSHRIEREYRGSRGYSIYARPNDVRHIVGGQKR